MSNNINVKFKLRQIDYIAAALIVIAIFGIFQLQLFLNKIDLDKFYLDLRTFYRDCNKTQWNLRVKKNMPVLV